MKPSLSTVELSVLVVSGLVSVGRAIDATMRSMSPSGLLPFLSCGRPIQLLQGDARSFRFGSLPGLPMADRSTHWLAELFASLIAHPRSFIGNRRPKGTHIGAECGPTWGSHDT